MRHSPRKRNIKIVATILTVGALLTCSWAVDTMQFPYPDRRIPDQMPEGMTVSVAIQPEMVQHLLSGAYDTYQQRPELLEKFKLALAGALDENLTEQCPGASTNKDLLEWQISIEYEERQSTAEVIIGTLAIWPFPAYWPIQPIRYKISVNSALSHSGLNSKFVKIDTLRTGDRYLYSYARTGSIEAEIRSSIEDNIATSANALCQLLEDHE